MIILAIDTALAAAAACVFDSASGEILAQETVWQDRGHDRTILPLIDRVTAQCGGPQAIERVAVTVGPGSFTGLRVGISAARAIGLGLNAPVVGVSTLAALVAPVVLDAGEGVAAAAIDARHGRIYVAAFLEGRPIVSPRVASPREAARAMGSGPIRAVGSGAAALVAEASAIGLAASVIDAAGAPDIGYVARLGAAADPKSAPARPLYLKAPDVKPPEPVALTA